MTIIAADGSLAASEGLDGVTERSKDMAFRVPSADGMPVATVIVTQYMTVMEPQARSCITSLLTQTLRHLSLPILVRNFRCACCVA